MSSWPSTASARCPASNACSSTTMLVRANCCFQTIFHKRHMGGGSAGWVGGVRGSISMFLVELTLFPRHTKLSSHAFLLLAFFIADKREEYDEPHFALIDTLFSLAEAYLFMQASLARVAGPLACRAHPDCCAPACLNQSGDELTSLPEARLAACMKPAASLAQPSLCDCRSCGLLQRRLAPEPAQSDTSLPTQPVLNLTSVQPCPLQPACLWFSSSSSRMSQAPTCHLARATQTSIGGLPPRCACCPPCPWPGRLLHCILLGSLGMVHIGWRKVVPRCCTAGLPAGCFP